MTKSKLLTAGLIAVAMLATPVMARENRHSARHLAEGAEPNDAGATGALVKMENGPSGLGGVNAMNA
jgi:hypothetical protein